MAVLRVGVLLRAAATLRSSPPFASFTGGLLVLGLVLQLVSLRLIVGPFGRVWFRFPVPLVIATLSSFFGLILLLTLALLVFQPLLCQLSPLGFTP